MSPRASAPPTAAARGRRDDLGTGFAATDSSRRSTSRRAARLLTSWADGARADLGITVPGFPEPLLVYGPNTNLGGSSIIGMLEAQAGCIAVARRVATAAGDYGRPEAWEAYDAEMQRRRPRCLGGLRQLVPRRRADHHQLARHGGRVPAPHRRSRLVGAGGGRGQPEMFTIQSTPYLSVNMPNESPHGAFSKGTVMLPPSLRLGEPASQCGLARHRSVRSSRSRMSPVSMLLGTSAPIRCTESDTDRAV